MIRRSWKPGCAVAIGCLILILSCALSRVAVEQRFVAGPDVRLQIGDYWFVAYTTRRPTCPPYGGLKPSNGLICTTDSLYPGDEVYVIWLVRSPLPGDRRQIPHQLLVLQLN